MPIFEYKCTVCQEEFEVLAIRSDELDVQELPCIECEAPAVKQMTIAAFTVNGANSANGYAAHGREVTMDDFADAHKFNARTNKQREAGIAAASNGTESR